MPMWGNTDILAAKPKFPKLRTEKGVVVLTLANTATFPNSIIRVVGTGVGGVANNWVANTANIGNTNGTVGFNLTGPSVVNVSGNTIFLSQAVGNTLAVGTTITFSRPISFDSNSANNYGANTYLFSNTRMTNASSLLESTLFRNATANHAGMSVVAHPGWVHVSPQVGYVKSIAANVSGNQAAAGYLTFTANTFYPGGSGANASYTVNANGSIVAVTVLNPGANYVLTPTATAPFSGFGANAVNATFTITMGGRANRIKTEVLVALSNARSTNTTSGGLWAPGT